MSDLKRLVNKDKHFFFNLFIGTSFGLLIFLSFYQRHFFSWTYLTYAVLVAAAGFFLAGWLNRHFIRNFFTETPIPIRNFIFGFLFVMGFLLVINTNIQPLYYILPDSELEVQFTIPVLPEEEEGIRLLWVNTGQGNVHYTDIVVEGRWERTFGNTIFSPGQGVTLSWRGKAGPKTEIAFRKTNYPQLVNVTWNGVTRTYDLNAADESNVFIRNRLKVTFVFMLPYILSFILTVGYILLAVLIALAAWEPGEKQFGQKSKWGWLLYMLPMLLAWGFTLLIYWPGIVSNDSLAQWVQGVTGKYNDWQSGFHALLLAGLMRLWYSPALAALLQILCFAMVVAWGLDALEKQGTPRIVLWGLSLLFAALPVNEILSITLWKDIPYAIAFLWLTVIFTRIVLSRGEWVRERYSWLLIGIAAFLVAILRQNGAAVAAICLLSLFLVFRKFWKQFLKALLVALMLYLGVKGPLYSLVNLDRTRTGQTNLIYLHHIAAHVSAGTHLEPQERAYLDGFMPLNEWDYWCCYVGPISYDNNFDRQAFLANTSRNRALALSLFARDPLVDISHAFCASELAWRFENNECFMKSTHGFDSWVPGRASWIVENSLGLEKHSLLPGLVDPFVLYLRNFGFPDDMLVFSLRPAFWLLLAAFSTVVLVVRRRDVRVLLALVPAVSQTVVLILVNFAPAYRYHYGTLLASVFLIGLIFFPEKFPEKM